MCALQNFKKQFLYDEIEAEVSAEKNSEFEWCQFP